MTITRKGGNRVEGYIFDRRNGATLADSVVRLIPQNSHEKISIPYSDIAALAFSGRDTAAGQELGSLGEEILGAEGRRREGNCAGAGIVGVVGYSAPRFHHRGTETRRDLKSS